MYADQDHFEWMAISRRVDGHKIRLEPISKTPVTPDQPRILFSGMHLSACPPPGINVGRRGVQTAPSGFPPRTCGNDMIGWGGILEMPINNIRDLEVNK